MPKIVADTPEPQLTEVAWREIETTIEVREPCQELRDKILKYFQSSFRTRDNWIWVPYVLPDTLRPRHMRVALSKLAELASQLADLLAFEESEAREADPEQYARILSVRL